MDASDLKQRTKQFGLSVIASIQSLPSTAVARTIGNQLLRSGTSVGANYRAACRARSRPDFISKAGIAIEEADESLYWMEMLIEAKIVAPGSLERLMQEGNEIVAILTASVKTARAGLRQRDAH
jgi:four helix bundle protein